MAALADRYDDRRLARAESNGRGSSPVGALAESLAAAKIGLTALASPLLGAAMGAVAASNTAAMKRQINAYPSEIERVMAGGAPTMTPGRVGRVDSSARWFISSDLHRTPRGASDWPAAQETKGLYEVALDHYGSQGWGLIENGDVEDFWLVGGSTYGVVYDLVRTLTPFLPRAKRQELRAHLGGEHLRRTIENNRGIYDRIDDLFHRHGRYLRTVGNHDDCYLDDAVVEHLRRFHDGVDVYDFVVLEGAAGPSAVLTHGHHTDSWNAPDRSGLGRLTTWLASAVVDAPLISSNPGTPHPSETRALLDGTHSDVLTVLNPALGFNRDLYTLDELLLYRAFDHHFGAEGPMLLLGHTHLPAVSPATPGRGDGAWTRYLNSGSGVHWQLVTGLEWDGVTDPARPEVRLVGWHYASESTPPSAIVGDHDGRPVARRCFEPARDGRTLRVLPPQR